MYELYKVLDTVLSIYSFAILIYILMSWFPGARESTFGVLVAKICEPYLEQFRRFIPPIGMIDFSPLVGILVLKFAGTGLRELFRMLLQ